MKIFNLWLDESGDFKNDDKKKKNELPSLVGGILTEGGSFSDQAVQSILPEEGTYHSVERNDQLDRFRRIREKLFVNRNNRFVVFNNQECVMIVDNNLTYLNIIAEGILQLIKDLKTRYGNIRLNILIANRVDTTANRPYSDSVVPVGEYEKRLYEKLIIGGLESAIEREEWSLQTASARKDKRLMLADIVCNTFFTRNRTKKFSDEEREYIRAIYEDSDHTIVFTVFESWMEKQFRERLLNDHVGEAVANICLSRDSAVLDRCFSLLDQRMRETGGFDHTLHYRFVSAYIEYYMNGARDFNTCIRFLNNLILYYIPLIKNTPGREAEERADRLELDLKFYLMTVYTHVGNVEKADALEMECRKMIETLPASPESVSYKIRFENRCVVNQINAFAFSEALKGINTVVSNCKEIEDLLSFVYPDREIIYEETGKALGTRTQIRTFLIRNPDENGEMSRDGCRSSFDVEMYRKACEDSDLAIRKFTSPADISRQYLYRVQLETEGGRFDRALDYLKRSVGFSQMDETAGEDVHEGPGETPEKKQLKRLWEMVEKSSMFSVSAYVRLMAEGALRGWEKAEIMYELFSRSRFMEVLSGAEQFYHPAELIFWKLGTYQAVKGMTAAAMTNLTKAIDVCFSVRDISMNVIGIAIMLEKYAWICRAGNQKGGNRNKSGRGTGNPMAERKKLESRLKEVKADDVKGVLGNIWKEIDVRRADPEYYWSLSRRVTY